MAGPVFEEPVISDTDPISGSCECLGNTSSAEDLDDAFDVVSHDCKTHFGLSTCKASQEQTWMPEDAVLDCSERMLDRSSSQSHSRWCGTRVHAVQRIVVQAARDHSPFRFRAESTTGASSAILDGSFVPDRAHRPIELLPR